MAIHEKAWEQPAAQQKVWRPVGTYGLLAAIFAIWILQLTVLNVKGSQLHNWLFVIFPDWYLRPWSPITSTFSHATYTISGQLAFSHIFFNSLMLFFFGPILEQIMGLKRYLTAFIAAGALSGILQVLITSQVYGTYNGALGASGALMMVFGALVILLPKEKILIWGILPLPFWAAGIIYAALDILGAFNPGNGIGNFAHLAGMAIGIWLGLRIKRDMAQRGLMFR